MSEMSSFNWKIGRLIFFVFVVGFLSARIFVSPPSYQWPTACESSTSWGKCKALVQALDEDSRTYRCAQGVLSFQGSQRAEVKLCRDGQNPVWASHSGVRMELDWLEVEP